MLLAGINSNTSPSPSTLAGPSHKDNQAAPSVGISFYRIENSWETPSFITNNPDSYQAKLKNGAQVRAADLFKTMRSLKNFEKRTGHYGLYALKMQCDAPSIKMLRANAKAAEEVGLTQTGELSNATRNIISSSVINEGFKWHIDSPFSQLSIDQASYAK